MSSEEIESIWSDDVQDEGDLRASGKLEGRSASAVKMPLSLKPWLERVIVSGWDEIHPKAYSRDVFEKTLLRALEAMKSAWSYVPGFSPDGFVVLLGENKKNAHRSMGMAFVPAPGADTRTIWLNPRLVREFSPNSLYRVMVHEIAHLKRFDEGHRSKTAAGAHDTRFCQILSRLDPVVAQGGKKSCRFFEDDVDSAAVVTAIANNASRAKIVLKRSGRGKTMSMVVVGNDGKEVFHTAAITYKHIEGVAKVFAGRWRSVPVVDEHGYDKTLQDFMDHARLGASGANARLMDELYSKYGRGRSKGQKPAPKKPTKKPAPKKPTKKPAPKMPAPKKSTKKPASKKPAPKKPARRR